MSNRKDSVKNYDEINDLIGNGTPVAQKEIEPLYPSKDIIDVPEPKHIPIGTFAKIHESTVEREKIESSIREREKWLKIGGSLQFDPNKHLEKEISTLKVNCDGKMWDIAGAGAIGIITGAEKSRKTAILSCIESAGVSDLEYMGFTLDINPIGVPKGSEKHRVLSFDTEQREYSFAKVKKRIYEAGLSNPNPPIYDAYFLRSLYPSERINFIKTHYYDSTKPQPRLLVIDIIADLVNDINDYNRCQELIEDIVKMAGKHTMTLLSVHLSRQGMALGHLGAALARKCDFLVKVSLDEEDNSMSKVEFILVRDNPRPPSFMIKQDISTGIIYRPDLNYVGETNGGVGGWMESADKKSPLLRIDTDYRINVEDDDIPF